MNKQNQGFTFIEILVALAIIGILSLIAYPSYMEYIQKARRSDAQAILSQDQLIMERCYAQNFSYSAACGARPSFPQITPEGFYTINISNLTATTYTLTATPLGAQLKDTKCATMSVNQANVKTAADSGATSQTECWNPH
ncbi:type IV pilin protein [Legionella shakespearei]|uniref:Type-IV pilin n=1 Tax=Legionella shakespearei DSM 23087 TaxID=1122169 RepID=A0A0W0YIF2_9GAMM|nr:type IV pilin protein [Legionella shakespearei]KTD56420.1 type-IV pilin [Legionella shakespearei DSM 23087]